MSTPKCLEHVPQAGAEKVAELTELHAALAARLAELGPDHPLYTAARHVLLDVRARRTRILDQLGQVTPATAAPANIPFPLGRPA